MGYTNRKYPVREISIACINRPDHDNERLCVGDIVTIRKPHHVIGKKEAKSLIWLRVEGLEEIEIGTLVQESSGLMMDEDKAAVSERFEKRRYFIPLQRLKKIKPDFDIARAMDTNDSYQPFMVVDFADSGFFRYLASDKPLSVHGLIFDKIRGEYL